MEQVFPAMGWVWGNMELWYREFKRRNVSSDHASMTECRTLRVANPCKVETHSMSFANEKLLSTHSFRPDPLNAVVYILFSENVIRSPSPPRGRITRRAIIVPSITIRRRRQRRRPRRWRWRCHQERFSGVAAGAPSGDGGHSGWPAARNRAPRAEEIAADKALLPGRHWAQAKWLCAVRRRLRARYEPARHSACEARLYRSTRLLGGTVGIQSSGAGRGRSGRKNADGRRPNSLSRHRISRGNYMNDEHE